MRAVIQRVSRASVNIAGRPKSEIGNGMVVLLGFEGADNIEDVEWLTKKIVQLRIFDDENGVMNLSVEETGGDIIVVSQFTLHAKTRKGNRPSYIKAAPPEVAIPLYGKFLERTEFYLGKAIGSGDFGAKMNVTLVNDGPVTIVIDTRNKE